MDFACLLFLSIFLSLPLFSSWPKRLSSLELNVIVITCYIYALASAVHFTFFLSLSSPPL